MDHIRQQSQARMSRPTRSDMVLALAAGVLGALLHSVILPLATGSSAAFAAFAAVLAAGVGLVGSLAGIVAARLLPIGGIARILAVGGVTFAATLAVGSLPGLIGGIGRAVAVTVAVAGTLIVAQQLRDRARTQPTP